MSSFLTCTSSSSDFGYRLRIQSIRFRCMRINNKNYAGDFIEKSTIKKMLQYQEIYQCALCFLLSMCCIFNESEKVRGYFYTTDCIIDQWYRFIRLMCLLSVFQLVSYTVLGLTRISTNFSIHPTLCNLHLSLHGVLRRRLALQSAHSLREGRLRSRIQRGLNYSGI